MKWRAVADARWADLGAQMDPMCVVLKDGTNDTLDAVCDSHPEILVVVGDDGTLTRVATHLHELRRGDAELPLLFSIPAGSVAVVARSVGLSGNPAKLRRVLESVKFGVRTRASLRVVDSSQDHARLAFNFGMGLPFDFLSARAQTAKGGRLRMAEAFAKVVREEGTDAELVEADVYADWKSRAEHFRYLLLNGGEDSWFGVEMGQGQRPSFRLGRSALELFESRSRVGRIVQRATGRGAETFERIHIDTNSGYVLDGELFDPSIPRTIAVSAGPRLRFATI